jgi:hypothetical protein
MIWALVIALIALLVGGGEFDLIENSEYRQARRAIRDIVKDEQRNEQIFDIIDDMRKAEKQAMKNLNADMGDLLNKKLGFDASLEDRQSMYDQIMAEYRVQRKDILIYIGEWKENSLHGQGIMLSSDGHVSKCIWENGKLIKIITID